MYSPKIKPELVQRLYRLKHSQNNKRPMTKMVNEAIIQYLIKEDNYEKKENYQNGCQHSS